MPDRVEVQDITCAAGVLPTAPTEVRLDGVVDCLVVRLTLRIPPGHAGLTGIAFGYGHNAILPRGAGDFISGDDEVIVYDLSNYLPGPQWQVFVCNRDTQSHVWETRFEVDELRVMPTPVQLQLAPPEDILAGAGQLIGTG